MKEQLIHILDQSVCLSRKQMKEYLSGTMLPEEMHAVEIHLNSCPLCSMAMEGFEEHSDEALQAIASLNSGFLKEHFANIAPQIHLNSMAPAAALPAVASHRKEGNIQPFWRTASIAAAALLAFGILWYVEFGRNAETRSSRIAMADKKTVTASTPVPESAQKTIASDHQTGNVKSTAAAKHESLAETKKLKKQEDVSSAEMQPAAGAASNNSSDDRKEPLFGSVAPAVAATETTKNPDEATVTTRRYNAPLIEPSAASPKGYVAAEKSEKSAARRSADIASLSTQTTIGNNGLSMGGGRSGSTKYVVDGVKMKPSSLAKKDKDDNNAGAMELGDASFEKGRYSTALQHYKQSMNTGSGRDRDRAAIKVARCYAALGNKARAEEMLQNVINDGAGPERRAARRALRDLR